MLADQCEAFKWWSFTLCVIRWCGHPIYDVNLRYSKTKTENLGNDLGVTRIVGIYCEKKLSLVEKLVAQQNLLNSEWIYNRVLTIT